MWAAVLLAAIVCSVVAWVLAARPPAGARARGRFARFSFMATFAAATLIGVPRPRVPRLGPLRAFLAPWFFFALIITTAYIASLRNLIDQPLVPSEVDTVQGILDLGLGVVIHRNLFPIFQGLATSNATMAQLASTVQFMVSIRGVCKGLGGGGGRGGTRPWACLGGTEITAA